MLATRLAQERGFDEALLVTPHGRVLEAPTSTIFWVDRDGALCTPPLDEHILASITRDRRHAAARRRGALCTKDDLLAASEAFLASTIREVQPIGGDRGHRAAERRASERARRRRRLRAHDRGGARSLAGVALARGAAHLVVRRTRPRAGRRRPQAPSAPAQQLRHSRTILGADAVRIVTVIGNRPQFVKAAAVSRLLARAARGADRPHGPALRRRALAGLLRRARRARPGRQLGIGTRHRTPSRPRACSRRSSRCSPSSARTWCSSTATPTPRSPARSPRPRRGIPVGARRGRHALVRPRDAGGAQPRADRPRERPAAVLDPDRGART